MERIRFFILNYYRNVYVVIFVYVVDDLYLFIVLRNWVEDVNKDVKIVFKFLVGNKIDFVDDGIEVDD